MTVILNRWNDDKMDALAGKVDGLDRQLREQRREMRAELGEQRQDLREHRKETKQGFEAMHRTMIQTTVAVLTAFVVGFGALVGLIATQL
jgi:hypothetical protein